MEDEVPFDLKEDILCRLPVKSVVRFKGVCKRWLLLTKDPKLIKLHLQRSTRSHTKGSLVSVSLEDNQLCSVDLSTLHITKAAINPLSKLPNLIYLAGACNGLLCFSTWDGNTITLWNMSTKDHKILPPLDPDEYGIQDQRLQLVGFGYDPCNDDYKVVRVYYCSTKGHIAIFYSLRLNSWGSNYEDEYEYHNFRQFYFWSWAVYVSGALNWIARTNNTTNHNEVHSTIIGLDLNTENARDLRFPYKPNDPLLFLIDSIGVLDGKLCAAGRKNGQEEVIDIWVMEEYGKEESWKILFSIDVNGVFLSSLMIIYPKLQLAGRGFWKLEYSSFYNIQRVLEIGIQSYDSEFLKIYPKLQPTPLQLEEDLEQLKSPRVLVNGAE
ncbi:hypothetical protein COLO4_31682 [Corchorus olitorius]|uniref:Uncharacterized protein n=1 Tax=Corchorus olitorius TaxID=93759 RepID=A0A1R3H3N3_9ROSI|nr:hypothetical protein COLO4_31682 [Corchorus olitorius]